jgi:hypothetical protein
MSKVRLEQEGALGIVTLENPPLNQIDEEVVNDLGAVVAELESNHWGSRSAVDHCGRADLWSVPGSPPVRRLRSGHWMELAPGPIAFPCALATSGMGS